MDLILLSRLQFAMTVFFHFVFVPLTLGLSVLLAIMETMYVRTGNEEYKRMVKFWGKLFLINFVLGVVTGITLEFQFGTNWSRYSAFVGDIFGSLLAIEATVAFFLESTFIAVWAFGWERVSKKMHCFAIWMVALAGNISALWIILANGFMQNPVGYVMRKPCDLKAVAARLADLTDRQEPPAVMQIDDRTAVTNLLLRLGFSTKLRGYTCLREALLIAMENPGQSVTKILYPSVAKQYQTTSSRVERAIRHAIEVAWDRGDVDTLNSYFGYTIQNNRGKPTNSEFIAMIADNLRLKYKLN